MRYSTFIAFPKLHLYTQTWCFSIEIVKILKHKEPNSFAMKKICWTPSMQDALVLCLAIVRSTKTEFLIHGCNGNFSDLPFNTLPESPQWDGWLYDWYVCINTYVFINTYKYIHTYIKLCSTSVSDISFSILHNWLPSRVLEWVLILPHSWSKLKNDLNFPLILMLRVILKLNCSSWVLYECMYEWDIHEPLFTVPFFTFSLEIQGLFPWH